MEYNVGAINNIKVTTQIVTRVLYDQDLNTLYMCLHVDQLLLELSSWFAMVLGSAAITFHYSMRISILCTATSSELATHKYNLWMVVGVGAGQSIKEPGRITQYAATRELVLWFWSDYLFIFSMLKWFFLRDLVVLQLACFLSLWGSSSCSDLLCVLESTSWTLVTWKV
jgi:hypothetical protein